LIDYYFAYGSNMNPERVRGRGLPFRSARSATLHGYMLTFDKATRTDPGLGHAAIVYAPAARVEGVLYELAHHQAITAMDPFERAPINYTRDVVRVESAVGVLPAWTYFANPAACVTGLRPPRDYLAHLLAGRDYLSDEYYRWLESF
jgi:gamma-glutamylcyclotransferase (GGCT)/AIG2-like uncharacterized protein YtfP